ncbi:general secretion pathway protein M [Vibrio orientalis CIP 102891 = ATCC 33934]|uniref:Type II secretion system protein M n=1 Tax=Vibrio orientalis CIP 102891 = ATCC 33934 TaxID=675816 RepID=C9QDL6_VIBOR|nr:type II secretion system protein M [Vibrio orientalis]EEX95118.1 general secretion pathway protein M [Vibrio orientalis CIP 102891 = ATCC 33934]EGU52181.1 general secretion pathway protein M [Vibrio orientalis CIP 102891 = ATCC 33934]
MNNLLASLQTWWQSISQREQRLMVACTMLVLVGGLYWGIVQPVANRADNALMRIQSEKQLLTWVKDKADEIAVLKGQGGKSVSGLPINQAVSSSVKRFKVELIRVQPRGDEFQVWVAPMPFNQFMNWVTFLQETYGIGVVFLDLDKGDQEGMVEINRLQFGRG